MTIIMFSTQLTRNGEVVIPQAYTKDIPIGGTVRVILLWETEGSSITQAQPKDIEGLAAFVASLQNRPLDPSLIRPASGKLAEHLANPATAIPGDLNEEEWNQQWAEFEADMKKLDFAREEKVLREMHETLK